MAFSLSASELIIFSASSTKDAMSEVISEFEKTHSDIKVKATYGASGKAYAQLSSGLEYELFFSADESYAKRIFSDGLALEEPKVYANGVVALYAHDAKDTSLEALRTAKHVSIANPKVAPYGVSAMQILDSLGLDLKSKLVQGDNIAQSVQFVDSGAAEVGLVAFSLIKTTKDSSHYLVIDETLHAPLRQSFVITKYAKDLASAKLFEEFVLSQKAKEIFSKYGFK